MTTDTREALAALMVIAAECAQRKPLRGFEELTEATHIGHRQFGRAHEQADEAVRMLAVRLRAVFDTLAAALATQPAQPSAQGEAVGEVRISHYGNRARNIGFLDAVIYEGANVRGGDKLYASAPAAPAQAVPPLSDAALDVLAERQRQIEVEGWTPAHDDEHRTGGMAVAAACYAAWSMPSRPASEVVAVMWPWTGWAHQWFKPKETRHNLVRAGALILAELERIDRGIAPKAAP